MTDPDLPTKLGTSIWFPYNGGTLWDALINKDGIWITGGEELAATDLTTTHMRNPNRTDDPHPAYHWRALDEITVAFVPRDKITKVLIGDCKDYIEGPRDDGEDRFCSFKCINIYFEGLDFPLEESASCVDRLSHFNRVLDLGITPSQLSLRPPEELDLEPSWEPVAFRALRGPSEPS